MAEVVIDQLHASYSGFDRRAVVSLDQALGQVVNHDLSGALAARGLPEMFAVCIRSLNVAIDLESGRSADTWARRWADQLADGIAAAVPTVPSTESGPTGDDTLVIYGREIDVVVDVVHSVATGDRRRLWAWNQIGIWPWATWPTTDDVALLLASRPTLAGSVLRTVGLRRVMPPLTAAGWRAVAAAVAAAYRLPTPGGGWAPLHPTTEQAGRRDPWSTSSRPFDGSSGHVLPAGLSNDRLIAAFAAVPGSVWFGSTDEQRVELAVLALVMAEPMLSRSYATIDALAAMAAVTEGNSEAAATNGHNDAPPPGLPPQDPAGDRPLLIGEDPQPGDQEAVESFEGDSVNGEPVMTSDFGGVIFLVRPLLEFGVVDAVERFVTGSAADVAEPDSVTSAQVLAEIVSLVTGVAIDDPIVDVLTGRTTHDSHPGIGPGGGGSAVAEFVAGKGQRITERIRDLTAEPVLDWMWPRRARIDRQPGWIEVELPLDSVDLRVRSAALDLDPGFVWWLGSVVRFRYV